MFCDKRQFKREGTHGILFLLSKIMFMSSHIVALSNICF